MVGLKDELMEHMWYTVLKTANRLQRWSVLQEHHPSSARTARTDGDPCWDFGEELIQATSAMPPSDLSASLSNKGSAGVVPNAALTR